MTTACTVIVDSKTLQSLELQEMCKFGDIITTNIMEYIKNDLLIYSERRQNALEIHIQDIQYLLRLLTETSTEKTQFRSIRVGQFYVMHGNDKITKEFEMRLTKSHFERMKPGSLIRVMAFIHRCILTFMINKLKSHYEMYIFDRLGQCITDSMDCLKSHFEYISRKHKSENLEALHIIKDFIVEIETIFDSCQVDSPK
jgi:hypothetical protein